MRAIFFSCAAFISCASAICSGVEFGSLMIASALAICSLAWSICFCSCSSLGPGSSGFAIVFLPLWFLFPSQTRLRIYQRNAEHVQLALGANLPVAGIELDGAEAHERRIDAAAK